jgi:hypothetical protein
MVTGAFEVPYRRINFQLTPVCERNGIYKGRLFTTAQCAQIVGMAEHFAYNTTGWRPEIYTLTNLDLHVKAVPTMLGLIDPFLQQIMEDMPRLYEQSKPGSARYRNDNEPHLVKYTGKDHKGVCMHTDSADITLNVRLTFLGRKNRKITRYFCNDLARLL